jgi:ATP adenylyltransferase
VDTLWSPWRNEYIASGGSGSKPGRCVFCEIQADPSKDYPYISGHLLLVPYAHIAELDAASKEITDELMDLTKRAQTILREVYQPSGFNMGMNLGTAAGAGIVDHFHIHFLPRWHGDTNFMTAVGNTRVIPEDLATTYQKLRPRFTA